MTMTIQSDPDKYYEIIESTGYQIIVLGEIGEQWSDEVLAVFEDAGLTVNLFPWQDIVELRLQLELVYYPVTQLWHCGSLQQEFVGYHNESIKNIIELVK